MNKPFVLTSKQESESIYPYFFKNELIDDKVYICQKAKNIQNALYIIDVWNREKYNIMETDQIIDSDIPYTKYMFINNHDIRKVDVDGGDESYKILLFKTNNVIYTVCLLPFK